MSFLTFQGTSFLPQIQLTSMSSSFFFLFEALCHYQLLDGLKFRQSLEKARDIDKVNPFFNFMPI
jgi:hypothetical protein